MTAAEIAIADELCERALDRARVRFANATRVTLPKHWADVADSDEEEQETSPSTLTEAQNTTHLSTRNDTTSPTLQKGIPLSAEHVLAASATAHTCKAPVMTTPTSLVPEPGTRNPRSYEGRRLFL